LLRGVDLAPEQPIEQQDPGWLRSNYDGLSVRMEADSRRTLPSAGESFGVQQWTPSVYNSERRGKDGWMPTIIPQTSAIDDQQSPRWTSGTTRHGESSGGGTQWRSDSLVYGNVQYASLHALNEEARVPNVNRFQHELMVDNDSRPQMRPRSDRRPRTSYEFHEPPSWYDDDSTGRTRSHAGSTQHHPAAFAQPASYDRISHFPSNTGYDMRDHASPQVELNVVQGARLSDLERRRDQVSQWPVVGARPSLYYTL
jgi:hypothetical protein